MTGPEHLQQNPTAGRVRIETLRISAEAFPVPEIGVTAFVGGNNVGKSTILRETWGQLLLDPGVNPPSTKVLNGLKLRFSGDQDDAVAWVAAHAPKVEFPHEGYVHANGSHNPLPVDLIKHYWGHPSGLGRLTHFMAHHSEALTRAGMVSPVQQRESIESPPEHPIQNLQDSEDLLNEIDAVCYTIFRRHLTLDRLSGKAGLRVGQVPVDAPPVDKVTAEYRAALGELPHLSQQGDGMKSLLGLLLPVIATTYQIVLIDEPEAFLHPPQAFQLGATLAKIAAEREIQVLLSTHDRNLLAGLLSAEAPVSVIRLDREGDVTSGAQLDAGAVEKLWSDPVLRYSNVLDGVFHRAVVVAEADQDCRFHAAALDVLNDIDQMEIPPSEFHFVPAGGKDGMARIVQALRAVKVRVIACPDLDLVDDASKVKKLVEAFDGDWSTVSKHHAAAIVDLTPTAAEVTCGEVLSQIESVLSQIAEQPWTSDTKKLLKPALRTTKSGFQEIKEYGVLAFKGAARTHVETLLANLDALGICCVREGELERLAPALGVRKGPGWLPAALKAGAHKETPAQGLAKRILAAAAQVPAPHHS